MTHARPANVLVVGGGVSGAAFALHAIRDFPLLALDIEILEPSERLGAGLAYATADPTLRMNGPADCMSLLPDEPMHFDAWLRRSGELTRDPCSLLANGRVIARRSTFGRYVDETVRAAARASRGVRLVHTRQRAIGAQRTSKGVRIALDDGSTREPDALVLAVGHLPAAVPPFLAPLSRSSRLVLDPWNSEALRPIPSDAAVLVVGTGLSAADVIAVLAAQKHKGGILAVSRRGLFPLSRRVIDLKATGDFSTAPSSAARLLLKRVRAVAAEHAAAGLPWEDVILALREQAPVIWRALPHEERLRFFRHLRSLWDAHRYPMAPQISRVIDRLEGDGRLAVAAASILGIRQLERGYSVDLERRGKSNVETLEVGAIINCTGPAHGSLLRSNPLIAAFAREGLVDPDPYGLGLAVDEECRVTTATRQENRGIFAIGPLTRATFGEVIGFPQITTQPRYVASNVVGGLGRPRASDARLAS